MAFEKYILNREDPAQPQNKVHLLLLKALFMERMKGEITKPKALAAIEEQLSSSQPSSFTGLSNNEKQDLQGIMDALDALPDLAEKLELLEEVFAVFIIAEGSPDVTLYDTRAKLKARLSWI